MSSNGPVSIIIPMRNEERFVGACLESVLLQLGDSDAFEVLCVDGGSRDRTGDIVRERAARDPRVRLLHNPRRIVPAALNLAIRQARGDVIIRMDCHAVYSPDYVARCVEVLRETGADNVGGYCRTMPGQETPVGHAIAAATSSRFGVGNSAFRTGGGEGEVDTVPFGCFRRSAFERFGLFDERLIRNQDIEFNSRIRRMGGRVVISPRIRLTYFNKASYRGLVSQSFRNGLWNPYTLYLVGGGIRVRHLIPLAFVLSLLALLVGGLLWPLLWLALAAEILAYGGAASLAAHRAARHTGASEPLIFAAFALLHLAYGAGSIAGCLSAPFRFGLRRRQTTGGAAC